MSAASAIELSSLSHPTALRKNARAGGNDHIFHRRSASRLNYSLIAMSWHSMIRWCWVLQGDRATTVEPGPHLLRERHSTIRTVFKLQLIRN